MSMGLSQNKISSFLGHLLFFSLYFSFEDVSFQDGFKAFYVAEDVFKFLLLLSLPPRC